jgi:hypothetical protein
MPSFIGEKKKKKKIEKNRVEQRDCKSTNNNNRAVGLQVKCARQTATSNCKQKPAKMISMQQSINFFSSRIQSLRKRSSIHGER